MQRKSTDYLVGMWWKWVYSNAAMAVKGSRDEVLLAIYSKWFLTTYSFMYLPFPPTKNQPEEENENQLLLKFTL
jgi:hypothetical protein